MCKRLDILRAWLHILQHHHPNLEDVARTSVVTVLIQGTYNLISIRVRGPILPVDQSLQGPLIVGMMTELMRIVLHIAWV